MLMLFKRSKSQKIKTGPTMNDYADIMLQRIQAMINENNKKNTKIDSAVIERVNDDGTVDIYFPPDNEKVFTNISNQTPFTLNEGDNVEILVKNGLYSNCWVIAKHNNATLEGTNDAKLQEMAENLQSTMDELKTIDVADLINQFNELKGEFQALANEVGSYGERIATLEEEMDNIPSDIAEYAEQIAEIKGRLTALETAMDNLGTTSNENLTLNFVKQV